MFKCYLCDSTDNVTRVSKLQLCASCRRFYTKHAQVAQRLGEHRTDPAIQTEKCRACGDAFIHERAGQLRCQPCIEATAQLSTPF